MALYEAQDEACFPFVREKERGNLISECDGLVFEPLRWVDELVDSSFPYKALPPWTDSISVFCLFSKDELQSNDRTVNRIEGRKRCWDQIEPLPIWNKAEEKTRDAKKVGSERNSLGRRGKESLPVSNG